MPAELGYPYSTIAISAPLNATQLAALEAPDQTLINASLSGTTLTVGGQAVTVHDIVDDVRSIRISTTAGRINQTTPASRAVVERRGRVRWQMDWTCYYNYDANSSYPLLVRDDPDASSARVIFVVRADDREMTGLVNILDVQEQEQPTEDGEALFVVSFGNRSHNYYPRWE